jgi:flagellar biosynthesis protein FlhF
LDSELAIAVTEGRALTDVFEVDATLGKANTTNAAVALVGPPGAGKSTTLIKLAANYGIALGKSVQILSADTHRIAAADQLRTLAGILGVGCDVVETPMALARALAEHRMKDLILIDTPGLAPGDMDDSIDLAHVIASHPEMDTHLVLSAAMKPADMSRAAERFGMFRPRKLIYTHLDETARYGALISEAARRTLAISFLAAGQRIPDDLEPASRHRLVELVLGADAAARSIGAAA